MVTNYTDPFAQEIADATPPAGVTEWRGFPLRYFRLTNRRTHQVKELQAIHWLHALVLADWGTIDLVITQGPRDTPFADTPRPDIEPWDPLTWGEHVGHDSPGYHSRF